MTSPLKQMFADARSLAEWLESDADSLATIEAMADEMTSVLSEGACSVVATADRCVTRPTSRRSSAAGTGTTGPRSLRSP